MSGIPVVCQTAVRLLGCGGQVLGIPGSIGHPGGAISTNIASLVNSFSCELSHLQTWKRPLAVRWTGCGRAGGASAGREVDGAWNHHSHPSALGPGPGPVRLGHRVDLLQLGPSGGHRRPRPPASLVWVCGLRPRAGFIPSSSFTQQTPGRAVWGTDAGSSWQG